MFMKQLLILSLLLLTACSEEANVHDDENGDAGRDGFACPLVLYIPTVNIMVNSLDPLPPNLVVSVGGDGIDLDECDEQKTAPLGLVKLNTYRTNGNLYVSFWPGSEDYLAIFPTYTAPTKNSARVRIFSRATCSDEPTLRYDLGEVLISWTQIFASPDPRCSGGGYSGSASVDVQ